MTTDLKIPTHVPPELVVDYDPVTGPEVNAFPPSALDGGLRERYRVFYTPFGVGHWVFTRYEDIRAIYEDPELFVQEGTLPGVDGTFAASMIPLTFNPPEHRSWRKVLQPMFSPKRLRSLEDTIRQTAVERIREIGPAGRCDLPTDFAIALPAATFCGLLGLPQSDFRSFNQLAFDMVYTPDQVRKEQGDEAAMAFRAAKSQEIVGLVLGLIERRRAEPSGDIVSFLLSAAYEDRPLTDAEILNITHLLFFAGTDSTGAMITYSLMFLADHPEYKQRLLDSPEIIPQAAEELIRYHGFHNITRDVSRDTEFAGVQLKRGDRVMLPNGSANHDSRMYPAGDTVDFDRQPRGAVTFGAGPHRCIGSPLATLQVKVALEEFVKALPDYAIAPDDVVKYACMTNKSIPSRVPIVYTPRSFG